MHTPPAVEFLDLLGQYNVKLVLFGHTHCSKAFHYNGMAVGGPTPLCFGGYDGNSRGYRLVRFTEHGFEFDLVQQTTKARRDVKPHEGVPRRSGRSVGPAMEPSACQARPTAPRPSVMGRSSCTALRTTTSVANAGVYAVDSKSGR